MVRYTRRECPVRRERPAPDEMLKAAEMAALNAVLEAASRNGDMASLCGAVIEVSVTLTHAVEGAVLEIKVA